MDKIDCTTHLRTEGTKLWNRLTSGRIKVSESVKNFGLPSPDNVLDDNMTDIVYMNLQIIDELTILLSDTSLTELTSLTPNIPYEDDKKEKPILYNKKGDYNYVTYTISGSGDYEQIRRFVNKLSNSKRFLFLLRNMTLEPEERGFGPPSEWKPQMSKDERVMYKTMTQIKFTLTVDYVELVNKASGTTAKSK